MKLREHPLMSYCGVPNWPPAWGPVKKDSTKTATGEVGVLVYVHFNCSEEVARCYVFMEHKEDTFVSILMFDDSAFCEQVYEFLSLHLKKSIKEIGDLEL